MSEQPGDAAAQIRTAEPVAPPSEPLHETVVEPAKLLRIASMVRELLEDTRQASLDDAGRKRLAEIYQRSVAELGESISADLKDELAGLAPPLDSVPSESEIRIAQAQLVGWLEGLFQGIQATLFTQQMSAQGQFDEMRRRAIESGQPPPQAPPGSGYL
jgi:proteasome activator-like protein